MPQPVDRRPLSSGQLKMHADTKKPRIVEIASRSMYGEVITGDEVKEAFLAIESTVALERCAASIVLLLSRSSESSAVVALNTLERQCGNTPPEVESFWLICAVGFIPDETLMANESIRLFIYRSSFSEQTACRSNTMNILGRLAQCGDSIALEILRICALSSELKVRTNAQSSLRALGYDHGGGGGQSGEM